MLALARQGAVPGTGASQEEMGRSASGVTAGGIGFPGVQARGAAHH
jgi:hypothetical protein